MLRLLSMMNIFSTNQLFRHSKTVTIMWEGHKKTLFVDLTLLIWVNVKSKIFQILWPSHNIVTQGTLQWFLLNFESVCALARTITYNWVKMRTIAYNLLDMLLKTFIGLFSITRSKLLPWICCNQYLTFFSRTYYSLTINFQLVFSRIDFSTLRSSLLERHSIFILWPKPLHSRTWKTPTISKKH